MNVPAPVAQFLRAPTPAAWVDAARQRVPELLLDHANCEKKAAATALSLMFRYPEQTGMAARMSRLAREELRHFEQVSKLLQQREVAVRRVPASGYAGSLRAAIRSDEPGRLVDTLIVCALIEARSCERFALLVPVLPDDVAALYSGLLHSEQRHFEVYLGLARQLQSQLDERIDRLAQLEASLVGRRDPVFAFHSGVPAATTE
ncbi:MAG: tRNA-(ms[2]io[6]A)-hydroxylase [Gammaproteobacteria bacterium]|nr:tRNA-(ms[2]io[6]A)-hydroxylase [Gammaproteobacteria bacterium]NNF62060.1 tRNA-(ms[2]io[6]A)-hydroxylase [Gammaproteobacteria bacterium]NNM20671.1 tRNA-(ms[2]io[6]A)-hydroxylase [Gammaproteobacteria bacterium]